jgi:hypothetical protein
MKKSIMVLILVVSISLLFSQNFPPPVNLRVEIFGDIPYLAWDPPISSSSSEISNDRDLYEYCVYGDGNQLAFVQMSSYSLYFFPPGTFTFFVTALYENPSGESEPSNTVTFNNTSIEENSLAQINAIGNHPNPFNPSTTIKFSIQNDSKIDLSIFNIKGQKNKTLSQEKFTKGNHSIIWNGDDEMGNSVSSGLYLYKLMINGKTEAVKKCLLLK